MSNNLLNYFLFTPIICAFLIAISVFLKNTIYLRRIFKFIFSFEFVLSFLILITQQQLNFSYFNIEFSLDKFNCYLIFLVSFIFFLFSLISKTLITKMHKIFYVLVLLLYGLINLTLLCDNIFAILALIFWIFLIFYTLSISFSKNEGKRNIVFQLMGDLFWYLISVFLIIKDFARYFVINDIGFNFTILTENLYKIDDCSISLAFVGFLIIIARLFNLIPFCTKNATNSIKIYPFVYGIQIFSSAILGIYLFSKAYLNFDYLFYQMQEIITIFLLINFIVFVFLSLKQENMFKFLNNVFFANIIIGMFCIFSFGQECFRIFAYFSLVLCLGYVFCLLILLILSNKYKTCKFEELKRLNDSTKMFPLFITVSFLNLASVPILSFFSAELICFAQIFSVEYECTILNVSPYVLIFGAFLLSTGIYNSLYKILIEPSEKSIEKTQLSHHQIFVYSLLVFAVAILSFSPNYVFQYIGEVLKIGNF